MIVFRCVCPLGDCHEFYRTHLDQYTASRALFDHLRDFFGGKNLFPYIELLNVKYQIESNQIESNRIKYTFYCLILVQQNFVV